MCSEYCFLGICCFVFFFAARRQEKIDEEGVQIQSCFSFANHLLKAEMKVERENAKDFGPITSFTGEDVQKLRVDLGLSTRISGDKIAVDLPRLYVTIDWTWVTTKKHFHSILPSFFIMMISLWGSCFHVYMVRETECFVTSTADFSLHRLSGRVP